MPARVDHAAHARPCCRRRRVGVRRRPCRCAPSPGAARADDTQRRVVEWASLGDDVHAPPCGPVEHAGAGDCLSETEPMRLDRRRACRAPAPARGDSTGISRIAASTLVCITSVEVVRRPARQVAAGARAVDAGVDHRHGQPLAGRAAGDARDDRGRVEHVERLSVGAQAAQPASRRPALRWVARRAQPSARYCRHELQSDAAAGADDQDHGAVIGRRPRSYCRSTDHRPPSRSLRRRRCTAPPRRACRRSSSARRAA